MPYEPFHERFPEIAEKETRTIIAFNDPDLPEDEYALLEAYCNEPDCDCRRVFFNVGSWRTGEILAVISYGWESKRFYARWFGDNNPEIIKEMQGPILNLSSKQSDLAPVLLQRVKHVLKDRRYLNRIKRHYQMFKEVVDSEADEEAETLPRRSKMRIGRNELCPCGSGKKYKKCCGR
jgi:hypothetical protein